MIFSNFFNSWKNYFKLKDLCEKSQYIIFYAENSSDWAFLNSILKELRNYKENILIITSDSNDKVILEKNSYYVGSESALNFLFRGIKAKAIIMTLTDLNNFYIKKSIHPIHYFYVFHSLVSTHRVYREKAFNAYDTILCTGEYQIKEIRKSEKIYNLKKKKLEKHGYGRLDFLISKYQKKESLVKSETNVLIAPTWGKSSIFENTLDKLIEILIKSNFKITLRLHPMTKRHYPKKIKELISKYLITDNFYYDEELENANSLINADIMISDWSGSAMEYAFATEKPVISIDTKPKINNKNWKELGYPCLEEEIRDKIGIIIKEADLENIPVAIKDLVINKEKWIKEIVQLRNQTVFNVGKSGSEGAKIILKN